MAGWQRLITFVVLLTTAQAKEIPSIQTPSENQVIEVTEAAVAVVQYKCASGISLPRPKGCIGRSHWRLSDAERRSLPALPNPGQTALCKAAAIGFDLWNPAQTLQADPGSDLLVSFAIKATQPRRAIIGLGCVDEALMWNGERLIFATVGNRGFIRTQNLVPIELQPGENLIRILSRKAKPWKEVPEEHNTDQWLLSVEVYASAPAAWAAFRSRNFHLTDTPIVDDLANVRLESILPAKDAVALCDLQGREVSHGVADSDGRVTWTDTLPALPFLGFVTQGGDDAEALMATGGLDIARISDDALQGQGAVGRNGGWKKRANHLLRPEFIPGRERWWARKLMLSLIMGVAHPDCSTVQALLRKYKPGSIRLAEYRSEIDGTTQYYRIFAREKDLLNKRPVIVLLPPVNAPVRPYLEGMEMTDLQGAENIAALAEEHGVIALWPGIVDVDYGGDLARRELDECLDQATRSFRIEGASKYLLGTCSSGILAIGYAETRKVSGVLLQTPIIARTKHRWFQGLAVDRVTYPMTVLEQEQTTSLLGQLAKLPVYLVYNMDLPGHGDRYESKRLCDLLAELGGDLEQHWPVPEKAYFWAERARQAFEPMFDWVVSKEVAHPMDGVEREESSPSAKAETVKAAMLDGFSVRMPTDPVLAEWMNRWGRLWSSFRGERWALESPSRSARTVVSGHVLGNQDVDMIKSGDFFSGTPQEDKRSLSSVTDQDELFGFRVIPSNAPASVELLRSSNATRNLPYIDLLVDGCCRGVLWRRKDGQWVLVNLWL